MKLECSATCMQIVTNPLISGFVEETPLAHACARGYLDMVKLLISHKANVNYKCSVSSSSTTDNCIFYPTFILRIMYHLLLLLSS